MKVTLKQGDITRERADAIGAVLEFESEPGRGTTVRCRLENRQ